MQTSWWKSKSLWSFVCVAFGLAFLQLRQYIFLTVFGVLLILIGIILTMIGRNQGGSDGQFARNRHCLVGDYCFVYCQSHLRIGQLAHTSSTLEEQKLRASMSSVDPEPVVCPLLAEATGFYFSGFDNESLELRYISLLDSHLNHGCQGVFFYKLVIYLILHRLNYQWP